MAVPSRSLVRDVRVPAMRFRAPREYARAVSRSPVPESRSRPVRRVSDRTAASFAGKADRFPPACPTDPALYRERMARAAVSDYGKSFCVLLPTAHPHTKELIRQFHQGCDGSIEVPAALEIVRDLLNRSVHRAQGFTIALARATVPISVARNEAIHTSQKFAHARDAVFLPIEIAIGRCGEQGIHTR